MLGISLSAWTLPALAQAPAARPPIEHFFENDAFGGAKLSPSGRYLAMRSGSPGRHDFLAVIDLETRTAKSVAEFNDTDIGDFEWVNDERLVFDAHDAMFANADQEGAPGLFAVNRDGSNYVMLARRHLHGLAPQPWNTFMLGQPGAQDSEWIYVLRPLYDRNDKYFGTRLRRLNTLTGEAQVAPEPDVEVSTFMLDAKGEPRLALLYGDVKTVIHYRDPATGQWREVASHDAYRGEQDAIKPVGFGPDGTLYVIANAGEDMATLRTFDFATGKVSKEPLVVTHGYDFVGSLVGKDKVLGVRLTTDAESNIWFDPAMKEIQAAVDKAVPSTVNLIDVPARPGSPWVLVESYSDRQPLRYLLYHTGTGKVELVGSSYPKIQPARMGRQEPIRYKARDGLEIPGLLTLPADGVRKNLPMVVLVHGGPWVRGASWGWNPESQFLASRGYAVLEVEYRGSTGFGLRHWEAGLKQWGLAMQNDIADGTRWAIAQGIADPGRICIGGASYGGYATLMGLVNDPDLYRCGFEWVGVTDIELMYKGTWYAKSNASPGYLRYGMPALIGDLVKDAAQLKATSPIEQAARITQPLLLAYGEEDQRVPLYHGRKFYSAVKATNKQVEWVTYTGEGHGWSLPRNRIDFWQRVERFLDRHIGQAAAK
jgi:dipeptidyl aminopeptidase/acylaminoacyl peptidase